ncbi:MAG: TRAP transporter small permease [Myxococcota bacterium]|nr:C4-dicarboxylate ABC transporter permease [Spirochaeta sp.]RPG07256.1 MAG: TRAP transporter small permease [Proteobacteria bacterium TMED72]
MKSEANSSRLQVYFGALHRVEDAFLALLLTVMVVLAPLQILLRNVFDQGIPWADPLIRVLVLWVGLMGAVAAARGDRHISIDAVSRMVSPRARAGIGLVTSCFTTVVCALVAWHSGRFVWDEKTYGSVAFSGIPAWMLEVVIPFAFALIAIRYLLRLRLGLRNLIRGDFEDEEAPESSQVEESC